MIRKIHVTCYYNAVVIRISGRKFNRHVRATRVHRSVFGRFQGIVQSGRRDFELFVARKLHSRKDRHRGRQQGGPDESQMHYYRR